MASLSCSHLSLSISFFLENFTLIHDSLNQEKRKRKRKKQSNGYGLWFSYAWNLITHVTRILERDWEERLVAALLFICSGWSLILKLQRQNYFYHVKYHFPCPIPYFKKRKKYWQHIGVYREIIGSRWHPKEM